MTPTAEVSPPRVTVELYGVARLHAGCPRLEVEAGTLGQALAALAAACPSLDGTVVEAGQLSPHFKISHNGRAFTADRQQALRDGDFLIVLSAAAGG